MKKRSLTFCALLAFIAALVFPHPGCGENNPEKAAKREDIKKLLELTGAAKLGIQVMEQMISSFKRSMPQIPAKFWDEFLAEVQVDDLIHLITSIYDKYLSHADIKALIVFYESPAGKRYVKAQPLIVRESMTAGQKWGQEIAKKVMKKLQEKGYK